MSKFALAALLGTALTLVGCSHTTAPMTESPTASSAAATVIYENGAFSPAEATVKVGEQVMFKNNHKAAIRIAPNPHPFHTSYPAFDSDTVAPGETWTFTTEKSGTIQYHNHFNPAVTGKVIVQ